jgi:O-antigen/teichoic acid export membrane protein
LAIFFNALLFFVFNIIYFNSLKTESNRIESPVASSNSATKTPKAITFQYLAKEIWPLLLSGIFFQVGTRLNTLIIFGIMGGVCLGVYSSGLMLITCFTAAAPFMGIVLFPVLNRTFIETPNRLGRVILKIIPVVFLVGLSVMLISYLSIPFALKLMKNMPDYASAIFAIMIWAIPFNYVIGIINSLFIIIKKQKTGMFVTFAIMLMNIALVYIGAFYDQIRGVALAYVAASIFQMALFVIIYFYVNNKSIQKKPVASI